MNHFISTAQLDRNTCIELMGAADRTLRLGHHLLSTYGSGRLLATLFYEPSVRKRLPFEAAQYRLGGQVLSSEDAGPYPTQVWGDRLEDTVRVVAGHADAIVIRHSEGVAAERAAAVSPVPIVNAGADTNNEHPVPALRDLFTIHREVGLADGTTVALVGDAIRFRSLTRLLALFPGVEVVFAHPEGMGPPADVTDRLRAGDCAVSRAASADEAVRKFRPDVVYMTRSPGAKLQLTTDLVRQMKPHAVVLHPLPRSGEIPPEVDADPRAAYFRQAAYGVPVCMAILSRLYRAPRAAAPALAAVAAG